MTKRKLKAVRIWVRMVIVAIFFITFSADSYEIDNDICMFEWSYWTPPQKRKKIYDITKSNEKEKRKIPTIIGIIDLSSIRSHHHPLYIQFCNALSAGPKQRDTLMNFEFCGLFKWYRAAVAQRTILFEQHKNGATLISRVPQMCTNIRLHIA